MTVSNCSLGIQLKWEMAITVFDFVDNVMGRRINKCKHYGGINGR